MEFSTDQLEPDKRFDLCNFILNHCVIIDKANHWSVLLFEEALAIYRQKPMLNHGEKAPRELTVFY